MSLKQINQFPAERLLVRTGNADREVRPLGQTQRQETHHRAQVGLARVCGNVDDAGVVHHFLDNDCGGAAVDARRITYNGWELNHDGEFQVSSF